MYLSPPANYRRGIFSFSDGGDGDMKSSGFLYGNAYRDNARRLLPVQVLRVRFHVYTVLRALFA